MELKGEQKVNAPRARVYEALNDAEILKACIPGCERLTKTSDTQMEATVSMKVGPVKARFNGAVELTNLNPPSSYSIVGEGKGGAAGFAKGRADVELVEDGPATILRYSVKADVGGKLAQLGSRLIDSTAKKLAGDFFEKFGEIAEAGGVPVQAAPPVEAAAPAFGNRMWLWLAAAIAALILFTLLVR